MTYQALRQHTQKKYLGFCDRRGYIYSVKVDAGVYSIVALKDYQVTVLITYKTKESAFQ